MTTCSMTFEIVERFAAAFAAPQRLAGGRAEFRQHLGVLGAALRARHLLHAEQRAAGAGGLRRRDAVRCELAAAVLAHPVGGPGRRQHGADFLISKALPPPRPPDFPWGHFYC